MFLAALSEFRDCERFRFHSRESAGCLLVEFVATAIYVLFEGGGGGGIRGDMGRET